MNGLSFFILNLKKISSEAGKKEEAENFAHSENDVFFGKNDTVQAFRIFRPEKASTDAKK
jgi:hypothetical protein